MRSKAPAHLQARNHPISQTALSTSSPRTRWVHARPSSVVTETKKDGEIPACPPAGAYLYISPFRGAGYAFRGALDCALVVHPPPRMPDPPTAPTIEPTLGHYDLFSTGAVVHDDTSGSLPAFELNYGLSLTANSLSTRRSRSTALRAALPNLVMATLSQL